MLGNKMFNPACGLGRASFTADGNSPNFNLNVGLPQPPAVNMAQNPPLSFLSMPPPNLVASQHAVPPIINTNSTPAFFNYNMPARPPQPFTSSIGTNVPDMNIFQNIPQSQIQSVNIYPNNVQNFGNQGFAGGNGNVMHSTPFSQSVNPFNRVHNSNDDNRSPTPQYNPWSPPPSTSSNFPLSGNAMLNSSTFQSPNRSSMWADSSRNSNSSETVQNRSYPSKFNASRPKASDINPWMKPPSSFADISSNNLGSNLRQIQSLPDATGYNSNGNSTWNANSEGKLFNRYGKQHQSNWKSGNFNSTRNNSSYQHSENSYRNSRNNSSYQHSENSYRNSRNNFQGRNNNFRPKEDNAGSKPYACDTCDKAFSVEKDFKLHLSEHIKCNAGNCDFEAHPKIVFLHKKMQHETGYAEAINKLKDDEEIAKWRAERKRRFPTAENIRKRKAEQAEKEARGEVIETKDFGKMKKPRMENRFNKRYNRHDRRNRHYNNNTNIQFRNERLLSTPKVISNVPLDSDTDSDDDSHIKLHKFPGTTYLAENPVQKREEILNISDENDSNNLEQNELDCQKESVSDDNEEEKDVYSDDEAPVEIPVNKSSPLPSAFPEKEDVESDDEAPTEIPVNKSSPLPSIFPEKEDSNDEPPSEIPSGECIQSELLESKDSDFHEIKNDSEDESPLEMPIAKVPLAEISNSEKLVPEDHPSDKPSMNNGPKSNKRFPDRNRNKFSNRHNDVVQNPVRKSTLLEKLLADDIRHERNTIMQCIRYIVNNNFLDDSD